MSQSEERTPMLLVKVIIPDESAYWRLVEIVQGEEVHPEDKTVEGFTRVHVLMTKDQLSIAQRAGYACEIALDYSTLPDPRDEVSKDDRYAAELERLRETKGTR